MKLQATVRFAWLVFGFPHAASLYAADVIELEFAKYEVREGGASVVIGVVRDPASEPTVTVDYATENLEATAGTDYTETAGTLTFAPGEVFKQLELVSVPILNDGLSEPQETFRFTLSNPSALAVLGAQRTATVTVRDNDPGVQFVTGQYFIHEDEGTLRITVQRGNDRALGPFTVDYTTVDGTAVAGQDYEATSGTLAFAAGQSSQSIEVPIANDGTLEADEIFQVVLRNPSAGASLGAATTLTVTLCDATGLAPHGFAATEQDDSSVKLTFSGGVSNRFEPFFDLYPLEVSNNQLGWQSLALLQRTNNATADLTFVDPTPGTPRRRYRTAPNHFIAAYPKPTGRYPVGRIDRVVTDPNRRNRYGISTNGSFAISVWYPAAPAAGQRPARWFEEVMARDTSPSSCWTSWRGTKWLDRLPYLSSYSFKDAPLAEVPGPLPVVLFSPGATVDRRQDTQKLEGLASHGYVVVAVEHYDAYSVAWPDGFYRSTSNDTSRTAAGLKDRVRDFVLILDVMTKWNQTDAQFAGRLSLDTVAAMGMSWGGPTVAALAQQDARCGAIVLLDGQPDGSATRGGNYSGFSTPCLSMNASGNGAQLMFAASTTNAGWFQITDTDHGSFANDVCFSGYPPITSREAVRTINAYALSFFNKWLKGEDDHLHEAASPDFPRVVNFRKK